MKKNVILISMIMILGTFSVIPVSASTVKDTWHQWDDEGYEYITSGGSNGEWFNGVYMAISQLALRPEIPGTIEIKSDVSTTYTTSISSTVTATSSSKASVSTGSVTTGYSGTSFEVSVSAGKSFTVTRGESVTADLEHTDPDELIFTGRAVVLKCGKNSTNKVIINMKK